MKYFSPLAWYNSERLDISYDFKRDVSTVSENRSEIIKSRKCGYEVFDDEYLDGILVSRTMLETSTNVTKGDDGVYKIVERGNTHSNILQYARTQSRFIPSFADPGTWTYVNFYELPEYLYDTDDLIDYYSHLQFDLAGSVDWPINDKIMQTVNGKRRFITLDTKTKEKRRQITLDNARDFIQKCNKRKNLPFTPFGTVQGYSDETYLDSLREVLKMGYTYIAIGGLPSYSEDRVVGMLPLLWKEVQKAGYRPGIHLYGRWPAPQYMDVYLKNGITSFDNNSPFIFASRSPCVYVDPEFISSGASPMSPCYGVKIPPTTGPLLSRLKKRDYEKWKRVVKICEETFRIFGKFAETGKTSHRREFFQAYKRMDRMINSLRRRPLSENKMYDSISRCITAIKYKGWERCDCGACKTAGAHCVLVRGPRIPFIFHHNTYVMYQRYRRELKKALRRVSPPPFDWTPIIDQNRIKNIRKAVKL